MKNIKPVMMIVALFLVLSIAAAVFMTARQTNAPVVDENIYTDSFSSDTDENTSGQNSGEGDEKQGDSTAPESSDTAPADESSENGSDLPEPEYTPQPTAEATPEATPTIQPTAAPTAEPKPSVSSDSLKAMWISYLEFQSVDFSSRETFENQITKMFTDCADMGLNTVIVQVRPFGDALYKSSVFPASHLISGTQGTELAFDPLEEMLKIAHSKGLRIEAWVNPYRVKLHGNLPAELAATNPAKDESLVFNVDGGIYYNPCLTQVQDMVVEGIAEIVANYDVDGIHLDDYFYPEKADMTIDEADYTASGRSLSQADWRRENVNTLVRKIYAKIKSIDSSVTFGISPQGNNDNNYNVQYSDVCLWMANEGYVDYVMPQLYWGFGYLTASGSDRFQFVNLSDSWAAYPRHSSVKLHIGLGAYRIGAGDGGANDQSEWSSGYNLMQQINALNANSNISGFALYRYDNLFKNSEYASLAQSETAHIKELLVG
ncbi:MAG: family 10 glycosylhydrolase [Oscillospiraceae bacterium]|nr:family 10 glycosylhydrolase [Oscillospiraceae bacterium]